MGTDLILVPEAQQDIAAAYCWYEEQRPGLGDEFMGCVDACVEGICRMPKLHIQIHDEYRRAWFGDSLTPFFTNMMAKRWLSTVFFTQQGTRKNGGID